ncbi:MULTISPECIES: pilus assembly protein TadG-related protein [Streptomyces]|uniref:Pilus assembly protein TadG-related protein n=2 Tax=Streptomyces TaxID=1883 RepID=A0ABY5NFS2_9ACTN|nr:MULTISPECIES: pilus assembly protein TadG-related protein [Streptomyces]UUS34907.1 pilus assembly protein TadG-related protein [Streptomyces changanensis]
MTAENPFRRDTGQASPLYVFMVASLLFLALAFFAVGQAGATRNGAQSAADAAALAAAKESRDRYRLGGLDGDALGDLFDGVLVGEDGCGASHAYAARNGAAVEGCAPLGDGRWGFTVTVRSAKPVGDTILPGTEGQHAVATATAVVTPLCAFEPAEPPEPAESSEPDPADPADPDESAEPADGTGDVDAPVLGSLDCDGTQLELDPDDLPDMADLFEIRLAGN